MRTIRAIPLSLRGGPAGRVEIRGEVYLPRASFDRLNREMEDAGEPLFANARNTAAGTMRNLDPALVSKRGLGAFVYQLVAQARQASGLTSASTRLKAGTTTHADTLTALRLVGAAGRTALAALREHRRSRRLLPGVGRQARRRSSSTPTAS